MYDLPTDIIERVKNDFREEDWYLIFEEIENVRKDLVNNADIQVVRSMLTLSQGNRYKFLNIRRNKYMGDPWDLISLANNINPKLDSGRRPFEIGELKPKWVSEYWTRDAKMSEAEKDKIDKWIYSNLFTQSQYNLKPKEEGTGIIIYKYYLSGESFSEMIILNNPFSKLPNQTELENIIYKALISNNYDTECYWITFNQSYAYRYDRGTLGEYEFENKKLSKVGNGMLYPLYSNLFNEDVGNSYEYNYALGTGLISKNFNWFLLFHFNKEKEAYIEMIVGGDEKFINELDKSRIAYL